MQKFPLWVLTLLLVISANQASADWTRIPSAEFELSPPPASGSRAYSRDFELLHEAQRRRTRGDCSVAESQRYPTFDVFFGRDARLLSRVEFNAARPLMTRVFRLTERVSEYFKVRYERPRPFNVDPTILPCAHKPAGARAYPSSHAALGAVGACVLAKLYPERAESMERYGSYIGDLRAISGVHHPSDVAAGRELAQQICRRILDDPGFMREFETARLR